MKKTLVSALTTALVVGAASTTFAAANPFSDVPADHWAYDAVSQLAQDGVIEGYGDSTYQGNNGITRYEMAQMVAKAMAKEDQANAADKALINKLAAEFSDELNNLGVRVANLEKNSDNVKWNGSARYRFEDANEAKTAGDNKNNRLRLRFAPTAQVNNHWNVKATLDYYKNTAKDTDTTDNGTTVLEQMYASGNYGATQYNLGKLPYYSEQGLVFDDRLTGAQISNQRGKLTTNLQAGRFSYDNNGADSNNEVNHKTMIEKDSTENYASLGLTYKADQHWSWAAGYHLLSGVNEQADVSTDHGRNFTNNEGKYSKNNSEDKADIWELGFTYSFGKAVPNGRGAYVSFDYANNTKGDQNSKFSHAYTAELGYGQAKPENAGSWDVYAAYRYLGDFAVISPTYDDATRGTKGWAIGTDYTFAKNIVGGVKYFRGKYIDGNDYSKTFANLEFFF